MKNFYDSVLDGVFELVEAVSGGISSEFKGANPFDKEKVSKEEMLLEYDQMGQSYSDGDTTLYDTKMSQLGEDGMNRYIQDMEQLKAKFRRR